MGCLYQVPGGREVCGLGCRIEDFRFADRVSFQLSSLSVEALDRDSSNCDASEHYRCEFKIRSHGSPSDCGVSIQDDGSLSYSGTRCPSRESQWQSEGSRVRRADASKSWRDCSGAKPKITQWVPATAWARPASGSADVATIVEPRCPAMMQRPSLAPVLQLICATGERGSKAAVEAGAMHARKRLSGTSGEVRCGSFASF